ncbi:hypothetical protein NOR51B_2747 [Luminiphilus syltensis NOR5-1B]|uniref:Uncharacterized protein n=1 Tax=Luminiphilus syltensis NOR5-1B TaxID=565045 RepID=B8KVJ4_9GAMM|nr:hypothetical protein NOR51B_2747 [Luminiphilus syltensis NOR5-1B]
MWPPLVSDAGGVDTTPVYDETPFSWRGPVIHRPNSEVG